MSFSARNSWRSLNPIERQIAKGKNAGHSDDEIARGCGTSARTIFNAWRRLKRRMLSRAQGIGPRPGHGRGEKVAVRLKSFTPAGGEMMDDSVRLTREQVTEIFNALRGIGNLVKGLTPKSGNAAELYAVMSNLAVIQTTIAGLPRASSN